MFSWQEQYLTRSLRSLVRYCSCHSNIKFTSSRHRVIFSIYYSSPVVRFLICFYFFTNDHKFRLFTITFTISPNELKTEFTRSSSNKWTKI